MVKTVAILGSCVSRDIFNRKFIPDYKEHFKLLSYAHQPSMISIMSKPIPYYYKNMVGEAKSVLDRDHFRAELEKQFLATLANEQPDILVMDFYADVMYGVLEVNDNSYMVGKDFRFKDFKAFDHLNIGKRYYPRENFEEFFELWKDSFEKFDRWAKLHLPNTKIVINKARAKKTYIDKNGHEALRLENHDLDQINGLWNKLDEYVINTFGYESLDYSQDQYYLQENHIFGNFFVHFDQSYYDLYFSKLKQVAAELDDDQHNVVPVNPGNLILNSNFKFGNKFWTHWNKNVIFGLKDNKPVLILDEYGNDKKEKRQVWSPLFEINANGDTEYEMTFKVNFHDVDSDGKFFCIRTFAKKDQTQFSDSIKSYDYYLKKFTDKESGNFKATIKLKPKGKYIKFAPFLNQNGHIEYFNFQLKKIQ